MDSKRKTKTVKYFNPSENIFFKIHIKYKEYWEEGVIENHVGRVLYMIKGSRWVHKYHLNHLKK